MTQLVIAPDDPAAPDVSGLLGAHVAFAAAHSPAGLCHYLDVEALRTEGLAFWSARDADGTVLGCAALRELDPRHGELKSMHVAEAARGRGVGRRLVNHVLAQSRLRGYERVSLDTGGSEGFAPSRALYAACGFRACAPFAGYKHTGFNVYMTRPLVMKLTPLVLENDHVRLEPLKERHREALRPLAQDASLWDWTSVRGDGEAFDAYFDSQLAGRTSGGRIGHAILDKRTRLWAGHSAFLEISEPQARVEIGWTWYGEGFRGGAVNPACKHLLLDRAFSCGAERVELKTHAQNARSRAAIEKLGAAFEGVHRSHILTWRGDRRDTAWYSILPGEWPAIEGRLLQRLGVFR